VRRVLALAAALILAGCSAQPTGAPTTFFFPRHGDPLGAGDAALLEGEVVFADACLWVRSGNGTLFLPLWPADVVLGKINDRPAVLSADQELLIETGEDTLLGGSQTDRATAEQLVGPIPDRCAGGSFWSVNTVDNRP
jgi:hypothetical protein